MNIAQSMNPAILLVEHEDGATKFAEARPMGDVNAWFVCLKINGKAARVGTYPRSDCGELKART